MTRRTLLASLPLFGCAFGAEYGSAYVLPDGSLGWKGFRNGYEVDRIIRINPGGIVARFEYHVTAPETIMADRLLRLSGAALKIETGFRGLRNQPKLGSIEDVTGQFKIEVGGQMPDFYWSHIGNIEVHGRQRVSVVLVEDGRISPK